MSQAKRIISKFGGAYKLAAALKDNGHKISASAIYKWAKRPAVGVVPNHSIRQVLTTARYEGILITSEDLDPRNS